MTWSSRTKGCLALAACTTMLAAAAAVPVTLGDAQSSAATGSLALDAVLAMSSTPIGCPAGSPPGATLCAARTGTGSARGLGRVSETYTFYVDQAACVPALRVLETTVQLDVAGKGKIQIAAERHQDCVPSALSLTRGFTITGGSGIYAGASGGGTVDHQAHYTPSGGATGHDTWTGTLTVPGLEFDVTPPTLAGIVNKTVRVRKASQRVRVRYKVTALDAVDGAVPVSCKPSSGSRFKVGRTAVNCSSTDRSANNGTARFKVVVKLRR